ncbi:MAG: glutamine--fructose-6-phosphate transaminase (isomerizing) [Coriobacteriales bacterium]|jgi:glucosamine--fructose-6-phosphate aminotransferase (isomerizing)|nr:glutamine--fructose-6-phosphate transaminase (isomerizing) [Coriobacteriales bacterium]
MCGIVAYTGTTEAIEILLAGLRRLEYRGYDSAGIALQRPADRADTPNTPSTPSTSSVADTATPASTLAAEPLQVVRRKGLTELVTEADGSTRNKGMIEQLTEAVAALADTDPLRGTCGIGHTRWATHGIPSEDNAHPHRDCSGRIAVVHNGIIENYAKLRQQLTAKGHHFASQTDSEVIAHLIEEQCAGNGGNLREAVRTSVAQLSGNFALAIISADEPGTIVVTRNDMPLVLGSFEGGAIAASDNAAIIEYTRDLIFIDDRCLAVLHETGAIEYYDPAGEPYIPSGYHFDGSIEDAQKGGYPDFFLKEIHEQPRVIRDVIANRFDLKTKTLVFDELPLTDADLAVIDRLYIVACGTSYHAGLIGKYLIENWARIPVEVEVASEFRYRNPIVTPNTLVLAISQSGETTDTLEAVRLARRAGAHVVAITNRVGSLITQEANTVFYLHAQLEVSVAATKSFLAQVALITLFGMFLAQERSLLTGPQIAEIYGEMKQLPDQIEHILANTSAIKTAATACKDATTALFIGRGVGATTCYEGALKLKEISYLHAEAYAGGEIKHGPIALIDPLGLNDPSAQTPVVAVVTQSTTRDKMISNIEEMKSRGAQIIAVATEGDRRIAELADFVLYIPPTRECLSPITASVPLQLLARYIAEMRGTNIDQPRNLAKSVTVE